MIKHRMVVDDLNRAGGHPDAEDVISTRSPQMSAMRESTQGRARDVLARTRRVTGGRSRIAGHHEAGTPIGPLPYPLTAPQYSLANCQKFAITMWFSGCEKTRSISAAGSKPWVRVTLAGSRPRDAEVTYWTKDGRTMVFLVQKAAMGGSEAGGGGAEGLSDKIIPVEIEFPVAVDDVVDERSGKHLGGGHRFSFTFHTTEAVFLSFRGQPVNGRSAHGLETALGGSRP